MTDCLLRLFPDLKRQTELHYIGWAKNQNKLNPNKCHYPLITYLSFFCKLFKFLFKFCTTFWILHIWCYNIEYIDGSTASRRYGEERQDDYDDDGPPPSLCETQISGKECMHAVSSDWFPSAFEWILNLEFCLTKLLIFYQKSL